ncbi:MAG: DMT family transporter [Bacteroidetes bacterium]|nr:DMT family transporter [Bacteroidota bacterium]
MKESLSDVSPMLFIGLRFSLASLILLPFAIKHFNSFDRSSVISGTILGVLLFFGFATQTVGLNYTTATKSGFITGSLVVMIPILQLIVIKKKPNKGAVIGVILVFIGILFLSSGGASIQTFLNDLGANFNKGEAYTLICAFVFALHVVYLDIFTRRNSILVLLFFQIFVTAVLAFASAIVFSFTQVEAVQFDATYYLIFGILYTGIFATLITTALQTKYQKEVTPTKAGIIYSFEPIFAAIIAFFALSEKITNFGLIGCALIFSGLIVSEIYESIFQKNGR